MQEDSLDILRLRIAPHLWVADNLMRGSSLPVGHQDHKANTGSSLGLPA